MEFILAAPDGAKVSSSSGRIVAHGLQDSSDVILTLTVDMWNLTLPVQGDYTVRIMMGGTERKRLTLTVILSREPAPEQRYLA
jgi:hypothetical protein